MANKDWQFALVDGFTQSRKTWRAFELVSHGIEPNEKTLCVFVTQANNVSVVHQVMSRCSKDLRVSNVYPHILRARESADFFKAGDEASQQANIMIVDFWHAKNTKAMIDGVKAYKPTRVFAIIDEVDQAGLSGIAARLDFLRQLHVAVARAPLRIVLVTATVANLSKHFLTLSEPDVTNAEGGEFARGVVGKLLRDRCIRHCYVQPDASYVGPSWFRNNDLWRPLLFPRKPPRIAKEEYENGKLDIIVHELRGLKDAHKQLCLIVAVSKISRQKELIGRLLDADTGAGFNAIIELNSDKTQKNYNLHYVNDDVKSRSGGGYKTWSIPHAQIKYILKKGGTEGWDDAEEVPLPYLMQACAFMGTSAEERIRANTESVEYARLRSLYGVLSSGVKRKYRRPADYPSEPRVAIVAGNIAGRGTTFQLAHIDFVCTSFCFAGGADKLQRGATNAQRFGRACGLLGDIFVKPERKPILITTPNVFEDALANERALEDKAVACDDDAMVCMKDLISPEEWDDILAGAKAAVDRKIAAMFHNHIASSEETGGVGDHAGGMTRNDAIRALLQMLIDNDGAAVLKYRDIKDYDEELHDYLKKQNKRLLNEFVRGFKYLKMLGHSRYELTDAGRAAYEKINEISEAAASSR